MDMKAVARFLATQKLFRQAYEHLSTFVLSILIQGTCSKDLQGNNHCIPGRSF